MRQRRRGDGPSGPQEKNSRATPPPPGAGQRRRPEPLVTPTAARTRARRADEEANEGRRRSKAARHPLVIGLSFLMLLVVIALVGGVGALVVGRDLYHAAGPLDETVQVNIPRGASVQSIAHGLEAQNIITDQYIFMAAAYTTGATRQMKAGEYIIPAGSSMAQVLDRIVSGEVVQHPITVAEGLSTAQIVKLLNDSDVLTGTITEIPPEGSLLPETYAVTRGMSRQSVLDLMSDAMERTVDRAWQNRDPDLPLSSPQELITLASIVEKETGQADERGRVAGVFVNRLEQGMRLQSDPTILYGIYGGEAWERPRTIFRSDLERPNGYNTYQIDALPPGPIANPGREALEATANPADTSDLYFVADGTGGHAFAQTYEEHQENVARWREIEARRSGNNSQTTQ